jgi:tyrosine-protein phosphatase YwqE
MWPFTKQKNEVGSLHNPVGDFSFLGCDMHSHLVPEIDDGSQSLEDSLALIRKYKEAGYQKLITTPHIHSAFFDNNVQKISTHFTLLKHYIAHHRIGIELETAAEYFLDAYFQSHILPAGGLLTFGNNYLLVETSMAGWPHNFQELIFLIQSKGYTPVLAHPERYLYETGTALYEQLKARGVLLQMNLLSVIGYYGRGVKEQAEQLLQAGLYDFCGSDVHHIHHMEILFKLKNDFPEKMHQLAQYGFKNRLLFG